MANYQIMINPICSFVGCECESTDEITFIMTPDPKYIPVVSPVIAYACPEHSFPSWEQIYSPEVFEQAAKVMGYEGQEMPLAKYSCIQIQPIRRPNVNVQSIA